MPGRKIQDESEVLRWWTEGKSYPWMVQEYRRKYNLEVTENMFSNWRYRRGLDLRVVRDRELIPWTVRKEHRWDHSVIMLRTEARRRAGEDLTDDEMHTLAVWKEGLAADDAVVHYDPDTDQGWFRVPREDTDGDIIRVPKPGRIVKPG